MLFGSIASWKLDACLKLCQFCLIFPTLSRWCWRTSWEQSFINAFYFINACHNGCVWFQMEPCVTNVTARWNALIAETQTAIFPLQEVFSESGRRLCFNFCFTPTQFAPHWASLEGKGGEALSALSPWLSLLVQSLSVLTCGWWCLWCCWSSLPWLSLSLSTSALWAIIGALLMAEVRAALPCSDPLGLQSLFVCWAGSLPWPLWALRSDWRGQGWRQGKALKRADVAHG